MHFLVLVANIRLALMNGTIGVDIMLMTHCRSTNGMKVMTQYRSIHDMILKGTI